MLWALPLSPCSPQRVAGCPSRSQSSGGSPWKTASSSICTTPPWLLAASVCPSCHGRAQQERPSHQPRENPQQTLSSSRRNQPGQAFCCTEDHTFLLGWFVAFSKMSRTGKKKNYFAILSAPNVGFLTGKHRHESACLTSWTPLHCNQIPAVNTGSQRGKEKIYKEMTLVPEEGELPSLVNRDRPAHVPSKGFWGMSLGFYCHV